MSFAWVRTCAVVVACVASVAASACTEGAAGVEPPPTFGHDIGLPSEVRTVAARVTRGATLAALLRAHDLAEREIAALIDRTQAVFDVRGLRVDQPYRIVYAIDGALRRFEYEIDGSRVLTVSRGDADEFVAAIDEIAKHTEIGIVSGRIDRDANSLVGALARAGERVDLSLAFADVLASEVDFNTELQPGDSFALLVEKQYRGSDELMVHDDRAGGARSAERGGPGEGEPGEKDGERDAARVFAGYGAILAVELHNAGRDIRAVRFTPSGGKPEYFDAAGRSLRRFFLKSPLKFDPVVTSRFSRHRLHPVLGETRAHLGVDYRAPAGAPVVAVADGVVLSAGMNGEAGRMVHIRHANGFETQYLHLSAITLSAGTRVHQGEIIGRVGATGLATGPHLDYRVRRNGAFVNPVLVHRSMPPGDPVAPRDLPAFETERDRLFEALGAPSAESSVPATR